ncbi:peptidyl-tRNA hydrolase [Saccharomonospora viridis]|jgi:peptidyl-tRNA hydrolase|uniref:peptidyl-tRNA hydrolase n=1 Tax=Saccharomonospora viridis TaxID=1852 RepID=UPI002408F91E|nr:peptidyl-tRNA hydrolase [Saccharomonospora viridis]
MTIADGPHEPVLAPVAARYAWWLGLPAHRTAERDVPPEQVWAMPVVLRMEKTRPPSRTSLLEAAASAALAVCLDDEARPGGAWYEPLYTWTSGHIRKVARRARGAHWEAVQRLPGVTVDVAGAQARALVPCRVGDLPREVARLQISGSDLPADDPGPPPDDRPVLLLNPRVTMSAGKAAAQVGHATMLLAALLDTPDLTAWAMRDYRCAVRVADQDLWDEGVAAVSDPQRAWSEHGLMAVRDAGFTEVEPGTVTVLARWSRP